MHVHHKDAVDPAKVQPTRQPRDLPMDRFSRKYLRLTLRSMARVITPLPLLKKKAGSVELRCRGAIPVGVDPPMAQPAAEHCIAAIRQAPG